ncbi:MAG TPA: glycoside hydrolase family 95 protein, partial [Bryobacteraceae bacterium]|nr:glycoside hydrolase family 95 protein [Bryobacteraceae bacterium]
MNTRRDFLLTAALASAAPGRTRAAEADTALELWYRQPAPDWNEALPIGNGRLGAMVFGGIESEHLQLNDNTLYSEEPGRRDLDLDVTKGFDNVVRMLRSRQYTEAGEFITKNWGGRGQPCYQPLGDLYIEFPGHTGASEYRRELDLATAVSHVRYVSGGVGYTREIFASYPDQVIVIRLGASQPGRLTFRALLRSIHPTAKA